MIMNMNEKGRQTKLLATIAIIAMVVCVFAAVMPSVDATENGYTETSEGVTAISGEKQIGTADELLALADEDEKYGNRIVVGSGGATLVLTADITEPVNVSFILDGNLTIKSADTGTYSLNIASNAIAAYSGDRTYNVVVYANAAAIFTVDKAEVTLTNTSNGTLVNTVFNNQYESVNLTVDVKNGSTLTVGQTGSATVSGTSWMTGTNAVGTLNVNASTVVLNDVGSFQANTIKAEADSTIRGTMDGATLTAYLTLNSSTVEVNNLGLYAANLNNGTINADVLGVFAKQTSATAPSGFTIGTISMEGTSSVTAETIINGLSAGNATGSESVVFSTTNGGTGNVSGAFTNVVADGAATYKFTGITLGNSSFGAGVTIDTASTYTIAENATVEVEADATIAGTVTNNGTVAMMTGANIGATISGDGNVTYDGTESVVIDSAGLATELADAKATEAIIYTDDTITVSSATERTIILTSDITSGEVNLTGSGAAVVNSNVTALTIKTTAESVTSTATLANVAGNFTFTVGSIAINGQVDPTVDGNSSITINGAAEVIGSFTIAQGVTLTVASGSFEVPAGAVLNVNGNMTVPAGVTVTNNGTINVTGTISIDAAATFTNNGQIYTSSNNNITGTIKGNAITQGLGLSTNMDAIASDLPLSGYAFLTSDLTIPAGKSISVNGGATLDLRGYTLTVLGTLNVASNGTVIDSGADAAKGIKVGTNGIINNSGIIGSTNAPVTISLADGEDGSVTLANVNGLSFGYKRVVGNNDVDYYLAISGDATKRGQYDGKITVNGTVYANAALTIGSKVDMTVATGKLVLDNGIELTVSSSGTASGKVELGVNSVVDVDGKADITVTAKTGDYQANLGTSNLTDSSVEISNVKGIEVTMTSESYSKDNALWMKQRLDVSGAMDNAVDGAAGIAFTGDYVTVTGTLTVNKDITSWTNSGTITVTGTVSWGDDIANGVDILSGDVNGTYYTVQTTADGQTTTTNYLTSFKAAIENIANAYEGPEVHGDVEVDFSFQLAADQTITGAGTMTIDEDAVVTVNNEASIDMGNGVAVDGKLVVYVNGYVDQPIEYDVRSVDAEYTTTYSGFAVALAEAQPGQTITVEKPTYVEGSVTIPEGVTVVVANAASLNVGYKDATTKADNTADLTVNGTLNVLGDVKVNGDVNVAGTADVTEATSFAVTATDGEITVTGTLTTLGNTVDESKVNAVKYTNLEQETVYTNLAAAAEVVNGYDVSKNIYIVGTVSDSAAVTLDGTTLYVDGTARLGTVTLDEASIIVNANGKLTATVAGLSGTDGSTVTTTVTLTAVEDVTVANKVAPNDANVDVYTTSIALTANATADKLVGAVSVDAGVLTIADTIVVGDKNTLTVASGAEAIVANGNTLTAGEGENHAASVTVDGTMTVNGTLTVKGVMDVAGTLDVEKAKKGDAAKLTIDAPVANTSCGTLNIAGVLNISGEQDLSGEAEVNGILAVEGTVTGAVKTIGETGYIKAYAGSDLAGAEIMVDENTNESDAVSTAFHINGDLYMTVYVVDGTTSVTYAGVLNAEDFEVPGYDVSDLKTLWAVPAQGQPAVAVWYTDADLTKAAQAENASSDVIVGTDDNLYAKVSALTVDVKVSVGTGISLYIDDVRITENTVTLSVGTHTVSAVIDPGYTGTVTISFNGSTVSGTFEVTADMASAAYEGTPAISATGEISVAGGSSSGSTSGGDDGMGLTDYLLIILVILIVIMAIMVAMRLMRS